LTMEAMQRQFGGPPVTLEEVHRTPALAGELLKQVSFLKDVAGIAKTDAEAYRILDAMKTGAPADLAAIREEASEFKPLEDAIDVGNKQQVRQTNVMTMVANHTEALARMQGVTNAALLRRNFGAESTAAADVDRIMRDMQTQAAQEATPGAGGRRVNEERFLAERVSEAGDFAANVSERANQLAGEVFGREGSLLIAKLQSIKKDEGISKLEKEVKKREAYDQFEAMINARSAEEAERTTRGGGPGAVGPGEPLPAEVAPPALRPEAAVEEEAGPMQRPPPPGETTTTLVIQDADGMEFWRGPAKITTEDDGFTGRGRGGRPA